MQGKRASDDVSSQSATRKKPAKDADTVGESDLSDDEGWLADALEADESEPQPQPPAINSSLSQPSNIALQAPAPVAAPATAAVLPAFAKPAAFEEEDDYDAEDASAAGPTPAASLTQPGNSTTMSLPTGTQTLPAAAFQTGASASATASANGPEASLAASPWPLQPQVTSSVPSATQQPAPGSASVVPVAPAAHAQLPPSLVIAQAAGTQPQSVSRKPKTIEEQLQKAAEEGVSLPVLRTSDGRCLVKYSDLMPSLSSRPEEQPVGSTDAVSRAKLRAERLNALKAQISTDKVKAASAAAVRAEDSDDESFLHVAARGKLPQHLVESSVLSQESDEDVVMHEADSQEQQSAKTEAQSQHRGKQLGAQPQ